ncbi:hypothetical protein [Fulvivirga sedimenti]|jgi:hypothetical protein|uniref:Uncharacterized protein n=1 Tax=Fulvivirga sedimenti TaxID=2879465 RepID=A0A9X1HX36_9BACT|nr:hypothetical protein [Fulvivirga sedimenti]MCA6078970.1 hypothetical protein [Fulvivirga sedimenti]
MAARSFDTIRVGKKYRLTNFGETFDFEVMSRLHDQNYRLKDLYTLESYELDDLIRWGKGNDFDFDELR